MWQLAVTYANSKRHESEYSFGMYMGWEGLDIYNEWEKRLILLFIVNVILTLIDDPT